MLLYVLGCVIIAKVVSNTEIADNICSKSLKYKIEFFNFSSLIQNGLDIVGV